VESIERVYDIKAGEEMGMDNKYKGLFAVVVDDKGSKILKEDNSKIKASETIAEPVKGEQPVIAEWDPFANPILAEIDGVIKFEDIIDGFTVTTQIDELTGESRIIVKEYLPKGYHPRIILAGSDKVIEYVLEPKTVIHVQEGAEVKKGDILAGNNQRN